MAIRIISDSTAYIPRHLLTEYHIGVVSLHVLFGTDSYREVDLENEAFYAKMDGAPEIPTSAQPSPPEIYQAFEAAVQAGDTVVGVFLSSDMSGTFATANLAKTMIMEHYPNAVIELVDSRSNSMEMGFAVLAGAKAALNGLPLPVVLEKIQEVVHRSRFIFAPEVLDYLRKGGRIGGAAALIGSLLQIKPILTVVEGKTAVLEKVRTKQRAIEEMIRIFLEDVREKGLGDVVVHHINNVVEAQRIAARIGEALQITVPRVCPVGPVIGLHVGPGTIGLAYYTQAKWK